MSLVLAGGVLPASAEPAPNDPDVVAATVASVAPPINAIVPEAAAAGAYSLGNGGAVVPATGADEITVASSVPTGLVPDISLSLPPEAGVDESRAAVAGDGTIVYAGEGAVDVAVQGSRSGVRLQTVLADASAPSRYTYTFDGLIPVLNGNGTVDLYAESDGIWVSVAHMDKPWARDARGRSVATSYRVDGNAVIQTIGRAAAYPVVADPNIDTSCVWYGMCYIKFSRSYTNKIATGASLASIAGGIVALIAVSNPVTATLAGVIALKLAADSFVAGQYYGRGNCLAYALPVYAWLNPASWAPYELKRGSYNCS